MTNIRLNKRTKTIKIVNRRDSIRLQHTGKPGPKGDDGSGAVWGDISGDINNQTNLKQALDAKENLITPGISSQYYRGDKTWQTLNKTAVGLNNVDNTADVDKPISNATQTALDALQQGKIDKHSIVRNVKDYGAVGNGTADDTTAIQNALNAGGITFFPAGTYIVTGLTVPAGAYLLGVGSAGTSITPPTTNYSKIKLKNSANTTLISIPSGNAHVKFEHLWFDGNKTNNTSGDIINLAAAGAFEQCGLRISYCYVMNAAGYGVYIGNFRQDYRITNSVFYGSASDNIYVGDGATDGVISECSIGDPNGAAGTNNCITIRGSLTKINHCEIWGATNYGVRVQGTCNMVAITGTSINRCGKGGLRVDDSADMVTVTSCFIHGNSVTTNAANSHIEHYSSGRLSVITTQFRSAGYANLPAYAIYIDSTATGTVTEYSNRVAGGAVVTGYINDDTKVSNTVRNLQIANAPVSSNDAVNKTYVDGLASTLQPIDSDLTAIAGLTTSGLVTRTATGAMSTRTITGTTNQVIVNNGSGVLDNPTISLPQNIHTGATPTFAGITLNGQLVTVQSSTSTAFTATTSSNLATDSLYIKLNNRSRIGYDGTGVLIDDNGTSRQIKITSNAKSTVFNTDGSVTFAGRLTSVTDPTSAQDAATKNYVDVTVANLVNSAPSTLDTLNELATALGNDPNFATTVTTNIATKLAKASNLSDLADVPTARTNLGLGTSSTPTFAGLITSGSVGLNTAAPTHTLTLGSTSTGLALFNTSDQTVNYERGLLRWNSNILEFFITASGTGVARNMRIGDTGGYLEFAPAASGGAPKFKYDRTSATSGSLFQVTASGGLNGGAGITQYGIKIDPTINQSSTAGYTALLINVTETATGSGTKRLADFQKGGTSYFYVDNNGNTFATQKLNAGAGGNVGTLSIVPLAVGQVSIFVKGIASQTADFIEIQNSSATQLFRLTSAGSIILSSGLSIAGSTGSITLPNSANITFGTGAGTKIGTTTTEKLAFWNATPIAQPSLATDFSYTVSNGTVDRTFDADNLTMDELADALYTVGTDLVAIKTVLKNLGLLA